MYKFINYLCSGLEDTNTIFFFVFIMKLFKSIFSKASYFIC